LQAFVSNYINNIFPGLESEPDNYYLQLLFLFVPLLASPSGIYFAIIFVFILLGCSALISSSEVAFFSLSINDLEKITQENSSVTQRILLLKEAPRKLLATILIANNFINIAIIILSQFILDHTISKELTKFWSEQIIMLSGFDISIEWLSNLITFLITIVGVTFLLVLFGEVAPKIYAKLNNVRLAKFMSKTLLFLFRLFHPLSNVLVIGTNIIEKRLIRKTNNGNSSRRKDIDHAIELTVKNDKHAEHEIDILKGIVKFGDTAVKQIMRPRVDVVAVDFRINFDALLNVIKKSGFSRIPVYDEDFDSVTGLLYVKDLLNHLNKGASFEWQELIRTNVMYVPEAKKIDDLLRDFQKERLHIAIVVDEFGGSSGVVTLEDIMEEVVGEIKEEFDDEIELEYKKIDDQNYLFEGKTLLNDVCRVIGVDTSTFDEVKGDADSVAGLFLEIVGQIPKVESEISYNGFHFKIVSVNNRRIKQILITLPVK
jgi:magnesium and cobalt exporter, CNNM family